MLSKLTGQQQASGGLDLPASKSVLLGVSGQTDSFVSKAIEGVVDEGVHDAHGALADTNAILGVDLLQHTVDVSGKGLDPLLPAVAVLALLGGLASLLAAG